MGGNGGSGHGWLLAFHAPHSADESDVLPSGWERFFAAMLAYPAVDVLRAPHVVRALTPLPAQPQDVDAPSPLFYCPPAPLSPLHRGVECSQHLLIDVLAPAGWTR